MGTAIKHPMPGRVKPSFVIFDIRALWRSVLSLASECPDVKNYKWWLNPAWHRMLYSCTHVAPLGVKGLTVWEKQCWLWCSRGFGTSTAGVLRHIQWQLSTLDQHIIHSLLLPASTQIHSNSTEACLLLLHCVSKNITLFTTAIIPLILNGLG